MAKPDGSQRFLALSLVVIAYLLATLVAGYADLPHHSAYFPLLTEALLLCARLPCRCRAIPTVLSALPLASTQRCCLLLPLA